MIAAQYSKNPRIISTLLKHGARQNYENDFGKTALDYAIKRNNQIAVKALEIC